MSHSPHTFPGTATATALGQWPGTDPVEAAKVALGLFPAPQLPEMPALPGRGTGSDAVGRTAAMLVELPVDIQPYGWRFADRPGLDQRRAVSALSTDINVLADVVGASGGAPEQFKVHAMGPLSLAASIHLHYGERALRDHGARRDIAESLGAGLALHAAKVAAAVPGAALTLQLDEPFIAAAAAGTIPTSSGYRTLRSIPAAELRQTWSSLVEAARAAGFATVALNLARGDAGTPAVGRPGEPDSAAAETAAWRMALETALESGADAVAVPLNTLDTGHWEMLAGAIEAGKGVWAGTVPAGGNPPLYSALVERIMRPWRGLGLEESRLQQLRISPEASLAQLSPQQARAVLGRTLEVADALGGIQNN